MPVYLFTYHAYGSWMPDHKRGYTRKAEGGKPTDIKMANRYRDNQAQQSATFTPDIQQEIIEEIQNATSHQQFRIYMIATDPSHLHILCGWDDERGCEKLRISIRQSITRMLNRDFGKRRWLAENASHKQVKDETHFNHLRANYLADHRGLKWNSIKGIFK